MCEEKDVDIAEAEESTGEQVIDYEDKWKRTLAELDNMRKRSERECENLRKYASEPLILDVIRTLEDIERALDGQKMRKKDMVKGFDMIRNDLAATLKRHGVVAIQTVGASFDPGLHEAVMQECTDCKNEDNKIVEELQKGWMLHDRVIRHAKVKVTTYKEE